MNDLYKVQCCYNIKRCEEFMQAFIETHCEEIKRVIKRYPIEIVLDNDEHILIMTYKHYESWCEGRTYKHYGDDEFVYHSGFRWKRLEGVMQNE